MFGVEMAQSVLDFTNVFRRFQGAAVSGDHSKCGSKDRRATISPPQGGAPSKTNKNKKGVVVRWQGAPFEKARHEYIFKANTANTPKAQVTKAIYSPARYVVHQF
jgi:hypothetical protein